MTSLRRWLSPERWVVPESWASPERWLSAGRWVFPGRWFSPGRWLSPGRGIRPERWIPPAIRLPSRVDEFDQMIDRWFERQLRNRPLVDRTFYTATALGDHGIIWLLLAVAQAVRHRHDAWLRPLGRATIGLGLESALVNGPVKWMFRRTRPAQAGPRPMHLRQPRTSSFPSGHATAAFFGAALLRDGDPWWPMYYAVSVIVASSRVHVRIHHASDVVGGAVLGVVLGELARRLVPVGPLSAPLSASSDPFAVPDRAGPPECFEPQPEHRPPA